LYGLAVCYANRQIRKEVSKAKQNKTKQNKTKQNKKKQNKTKQNKTKQNNKKGKPFLLAFFPPQKNKSLRECFILFLLYLFKVEYCSFAMLTRSGKN
jgi:hypothetical protein